jgi:hypothetical protein
MNEWELIQILSTPEFIESTIDLFDWDFGILSSNIFLTTDFIENHLDKEWDLNLLSQNDRVKGELEKYWMME